MANEKIISSIIYDSEGRILSVASSNAPLDLLEVPENCTLLHWGGLVTPDKNYVSNAQVQNRPSMNPILDGTSLSNLPIPCHVKLYGEAATEFDCDDGVVDFEFTTPGEYEIYLSSFPYKDLMVTINAS